MAAFSVKRMRNSVVTVVSVHPTQAEADAVKKLCDDLEAGLPSTTGRGVMTAVFSGRDILDGDTFASAAYP